MFADLSLEKRALKDVIEKSLGAGSKASSRLAVADRASFERAACLPTG